MGVLVDLAEWRRVRSSLRPGAAPQQPEQADVEDLLVARLDRAVERLQLLAALAMDDHGKLTPRVETELLAIMGELTVGLVRRAAVRAERLADRLAAGKGGS